MYHGFLRMQGCVCGMNVSVLLFPTDRSKKRAPEGNGIVGVRKGRRCLYFSTGLSIVKRTTAGAVSVYENRARPTIEYTVQRRAEGF